MLVVTQGRTGNRMQAWESSRTANKVPFHPVPGYSTKYFPLISTTLSNSRDLFVEGQIPRMAGKGEKALCGKVRGHSHYQNPPWGQIFPLKESFPLKEWPHYVAQAGLEHALLLLKPSTCWG